MVLINLDHCPTIIDCVKGLLVLVLINLDHFYLAINDCFHVGDRILQSMIAFMWVTGPDGWPMVDGQKGKVSSI